MAKDFGKRVVSQIKGIFRIPSYQRGYRWTSDEIVRLLDDIYEHDESSNSYYLQPIVVKNLSDENTPEENREYELIDGQQRLTTLFLIISSLKEWFPKANPNYRLSYDTRDNSWNYLNSLFSNKEEAEKIKNDYIDFRYLHNAFTTIQNWLSKHKDPTSVAVAIYRLLSSKVKVLWYEVDKDENGHELFKRLNIGRIPLTNAELIKALFLNRNSLESNRSDKNLSQHEIAFLWERMEQELRNPEFWAFLTNAKPEKYPTRLELIFDLMAKKKNNEREKYFTFFHFNDRITNGKKKSVEFVWNEIVDYFDTLKVWYENRELYNRAGCLVLFGERISNLIEETKHMKKTKKLSYLDEKIQKKLVKEELVLSLRYNKQYSDIKNILIWFNIKTMDNSQERFPFNKFKEGSGWSLEHIHAQNSEGLRSESDWRDWLEKQLIALKAYEYKWDGIIDFNEEIKNVLAKKTIGRELFDSLFKKITDLFSAKLSDDDLEANMHSIKNLALLKTDANSTLNNCVFEVKRNNLANLDRQGYFIPVCTRNVFTKYYSPAGENQAYLWTDKDRDAYYDEIMNVVYSK